MKKLAFLTICLISLSLVTAFSFDETLTNLFSMDFNEWLTGFVVQQYDAQCVDKEITMTTNTTTTEYIEVSMINTGKKWKKHEVGLSIKHYGLALEEGTITTKEIIYKGDQATFNFKVTPSYSGNKEADLTIEYQMQRLKGLTTKKQKSRRFGELCYIRLHVVTTPVITEQKQVIFAPVNQYGCDGDGICVRDVESENSCIPDCAYGDKVYYVREGSNLVRFPSGYYFKLYDIDANQFIYVGLNKPHVKQVPIGPGQTKDLIEGVRVTNVGVIGSYATIRIEPLA